MTSERDIPIPRQWPRQIKSAFLHAVSFASTAFTCASGLAANRKDKMKRLQAKLAQAYREIALLNRKRESRTSASAGCPPTKGHSITSTSGCRSFS